VSKHNQLKHQKLKDSQHAKDEHQTEFFAAVPNFGPILQKRVQGHCNMNLYAVSEQVKVSLFSTITTRNVG
jgi:hypothetical protein